MSQHPQFNNHAPITWCEFSFAVSGHPRLFVTDYPSGDTVVHPSIAQSLSSRGKLLDLYRTSFHLRLAFKRVVKTSAHLFQCSNYQQRLSLFQHNRYKCILQAYLQMNGGHCSVVHDGWSILGPSKSDGESAKRFNIFPRRFVISPKTSRVA